MKRTKASNKPQHLGDSRMLTGFTFMPKTIDEHGKYETRWLERVYWLQEVHSTVLGSTRWFDEYFVTKKEYLNERDGSVS